MKGIIAIFIIISTLFGTLGQTVVFVHYLLNKNYYKEVLCENKAKPKMHCNGKCHMMKEMKEQEKKEKSPINTIKEKFELLFFPFSNVKITFYKNPVEHTRIFSLNKYLNEFEFSVFHPPCA